MIVAGASRHAKEVIQILNHNKISINFLFDDVSQQFEEYFLNYKIIRSVEDLKTENAKDFVLALGGVKARKMVFEKFILANKKPVNLISHTSIIGKSNVDLGLGLNIMYFAFIYDNTKIGTGSLINAFASIHHDVIIGEFVEVSTRATLLGGAKIGHFSSIGSGAIILPNIKIGDNCIIGAGAVVTKDIPNNSKAYGVPARVINNNI